MSSDQNESITENVAQKGVRKMDTVVTGLILWGIVTSIYGVKKLREKHQEEEEKKDSLSSPKEDKAESLPPQKKKPFWQFWK